jgi:hypothetical protein
MVLMAMVATSVNLIASKRSLTAVWHQVSGHALAVMLIRDSRRVQPWSSDEGIIPALRSLRQMLHMPPRDNEMRVEIIDQFGQQLPIPYGGLVSHGSRNSQPMKVLVDGSGTVTNLAQVGLAGSDGKRMVLTLLCEADGSFTAMSYRQLLDS